MRFRSRREAQIGCMAVARVLQAYLDGEVDERTARRVGAHLAVCRRCGMSAATFTAIKRSLAQSGSLNDATQRRLDEFVRRVNERSADS